MTTYFLPDPILPAAFFRDPPRFPPPVPPTPQSDLLKTILATPIIDRKVLAMIDDANVRVTKVNNKKRVLLRADLARAIDDHLPDGLWLVTRADHEVVTPPGRMSPEQYVRFEMRFAPGPDGYKRAAYEQEDADDGISEPEDDGCPYGNPACDLDADDPEGHGPCSKMRQGRSAIGRKALLTQNEALLAENQKMREACGAAHDQLAHLETIERERDLLRDLVRDLVRVGGTLQDHVADPNEPDVVTARNTYHALRRKATEIAS